jgi:hypothetical protein
MNQHLEKVTKCIKISRGPKSNKIVMTSKGTIEDQDHEKGLKKNNNKVSHKHIGPANKQDVVHVHLYNGVIYLYVIMYVHICCLHV